MAYSLDLRVRVIQSLEEGMTQDKASERYCVSVSAVQDWVKLNRTNGTPKKLIRSDDSYDGERGIPNYKLGSLKSLLYQTQNK
ncbi:MAG: IS630 transposase-related protein [Candidatus Caenarcaniphilales bacterium]|nr:IS630 transposase-related protein [Candidatus Caenarcaniphilales bacterium]